jgi:hypothetical protein
LAWLQPKDENSLLDSEENFQNIGEYKLPITLDPLKYGTLVYFDSVNNTYILKQGNYNFKVQIKNNKNQKLFDNYLVPE